jgi:dCMP deaminase
MQYTNEFDSGTQTNGTSHPLTTNSEMIQSERPSFESIYMELAKTLAKRSTCYRLQVGTVITSTDYRKVLAVGYNGNATGLTNGCDRHEPGNCGCLHSEENAVINCDSPRFIEKIVFVTHLPCIACAKRLINLGNVKKVIYGEEYRIRDSIDLLTSVGIIIKSIDQLQVQLK